MGWSYVPLCFVSISLLAHLSMKECDPDDQMAVESGLLDSSRDETFQFLLHTDTVPNWLFWVSHFRAMDSRLLGLGKRYEATFDVPFYGLVRVPLEVTDYTPNMVLVLSSKTGMLRPRLDIICSDMGPNKSRLTFRLSFRRTSVLFQNTVGRILNFVSTQQLQRALLALRSLMPI